MKTPIRQSYTFPGRYSSSEEPYQIDWSALMEAGEEVVSESVVMIRGDSVVDRVTTVNNVTTFWLSGGTGRPSLQQLRASCRTNSGQTDAVLISISVPA